ncbi:MAG: DNA primase [Paludibacteraceae bacterium]|nr:DNA primase [Paludibacteraceae bacterium]
MIPRETIDKVFATAKIEEVVGDYVKLKRRGANYIGLCPFHTEKTGSFTVSPSKSLYKCFGCGKAGNAIGFVMEIEQCGFAEAIKQVAKKYHIEVQEKELTAEEQQRQDDRESMFVVNEFANKWFQEQLWETDEGKAIGLSYFRQRGLRDDIIRKFQLGYSPEKGNPLAAALKKKGFVEKYIVNDVESKLGTGLCGKAEDGRIYDRFRDRVMFPIHTVSGKPVAFAGRILKKKDNVGKYVNSPDSIIYSKTNELYGIYLAKSAIVRENLCYIVEGQMDVISMHQAGIENVVANGGTALTKPQIKLIQRFTSNIIELYDGDAAGIHAALRGIDMFLEAGFNVKIVLLPEGEDPDSFANSHNADEFIQYIKDNQVDFIRFKAQLLQKEASNDPQKRADLIKDIVESISRIPDIITRQVYIKDCSDLLHIQEQLLTREVRFKRREKAIEGNEARKKEEEDKRAQALADEAKQASKEPQAEVAEPPVNPKVATKLDENFRNLLQVIIRYGERPLYQLDDGSFINVGDFIIQTLRGDSVEAPNALYQKVIDEFMAHEHDADFEAERFYKFHADPNIMNLAVDLIADKYQLSTIFTKQSVSENVTREVKVATDEDKLPELVPQLLLELKFTIINQRIEQAAEMIRKAESDGDFELLRELLRTQTTLLDIKGQICKELGNRVVTL